MQHSTKERRAAWYAMPAALWPVIAASISRPWPLEAQYADLAYWEDLEHRTRGRERRPSRRVLMARWGVSAWSVRLAARAIGRWSDPAKRAHQKLTRSSPEPHQLETEQPSEYSPSSPEAHQKLTRSSPHARRTHTHTQTHKDAREPRGALEGWTEAVDLWRDLGPKTAKGKPKRRRPKQSKGVGKDLARLLRDEGVADVLHVIRWAHESDHERARFLRGARTPRDVPDVANVSLLTLCRAKKFDVYRDFASTWTPRKAQQAPEPSADGSIVPPPLPRRRRHYWAVSND
jgi:hypothetical protein